MNIEDKYKNTFEVLDEFGEQILQEIEELLIKKNKVVSEQLIKSLDYDISDDNEVLGLVIEYIDYGKYVLSGRRKGGKMPPVENIRTWLKQKKIPFEKGKVRNINYGNLKMKSKKRELNNLAWAVAKSIKKKGVKPFNFLKPYENIVSSTEYKNRIKTALIEDAFRMLKKEKQNMSITFLNEPANYNRCYDTNRLQYQITSDNYTEINFKYIIE